MKLIIMLIYFAKRISEPAQWKVPHRYPPERIIDTKDPFQAYAVFAQWFQGRQMRKIVILFNYTQKRIVLVQKPQSCKVSTKI